MNDYFKRGDVNNGLYYLEVPFINAQNNVHGHKIK